MAQNCCSGEEKSYWDKIKKMTYIILNGNFLCLSCPSATFLPGGGGYSHTLPIRVCAAQWGSDFEAPDLERGIHFRGVF